MDVKFGGSAAGTTALPPSVAIVQVSGVSLAAGLKSGLSDRIRNLMFHIRSQRYWILKYYRAFI